MIVLGIDPSLECGLALVDTTGSRLLASTCIKPGSDVDTDERLEWVVETVSMWAANAMAAHGDAQLVAIESPAVGRLHASPLQWRLVGRLEQLHWDYPTVLVLPGRAKQVVGLKYHAKTKPVQQVEALVGVRPLSDVKYAREAVADAVAVALAGAKARDQGAA